MKMVYDYFKTNAEYGHVNNINDVQAVCMVDPKNNNQLCGFMNDWDAALLAAVDEHGDPTISKRDQELMFFDRVKQVPWLEYDINVYKRAEKGDPKKTLEYLYNAAEQVLLDHNLVRNRQDVVAKNKKGQGKPPAAPGPKRANSVSKTGNGRKRSSSAPKKDYKKDKSPARKPSRGRQRDRSKSRGKDNVCHGWRKNGTCPRGDNCKYEHPPNLKGKGGKSRSRSHKSRSSSGGSSKSRKSHKSSGPAAPGKDKAKKIPGKNGDNCEYHKKGQCHFHHDKPSPAAPGEKKRSKSKPKKGKSGN